MPQISRYLQRGKSRATSMSELAAMTGMKPRDISKQIEQERAAGELILSSTTPPGGYYIGDSYDELAEFVRHMDHRARKCMVSCRGARRRLAEMQQERDDAGQEKLRLPYERED